MRSIALWRLLILSILLWMIWLLRGSVFADNLALWEWLTVCAIKLLRDCALVAPYCMGRYKSLGLCRDRSEDTLL